MGAWLHRPCGSCPFLLTQDFRLGRARAEGIARALRNDGIFHCHETVDYEESEGTVTSHSRFCGGALSVMKKEGILFNNWIPRLLAIMKLLRPAEIATDVKVDSTLDEWIERQSRR